jgi:hypothetical protein
MVWGVGFPHRFTSKINDCIITSNIRNSVYSFMFFSTINRKFTLAPIPPGVNFGLTLGTIAITSPSRLFKNRSRCIWSFAISRLNLCTRYFIFTQFHISTLSIYLLFRITPVTPYFILICECSYAHSEAVLLSFLFVERIFYHHFTLLFF